MPPKDTFAIFSAPPIVQTARRPQGREPEVRRHLQGMSNARARNLAVEYVDYILSRNLQGRPSGCTLPFVEIKTKVSSLYRELIMPPGVMSLVSHFGWLANDERGQRSK